MAAMHFVTAFTNRRARIPYDGSGQSASHAFRGASQILRCKEWYLRGGAGGGPDATGDATSTEIRVCRQLEVLK
jgi:hypothetical protein